MSTFFNPNDSFSY